MTRHYTKFDPAVKQAQQRLLTLNSQRYNLGKFKADGRLGHLTRMAFRTYQHDHNLKETGRLDDATRKSLGVASLRVPSTAPKAEQNKTKQKPESVVAYAPEYEKTIIVDPGHDGWNQGAGVFAPGDVVDYTGKYTDNPYVKDGKVYEADLNMGLAKEVCAALQRKGYNPVLTHDGPTKKLDIAKDGSQQVMGWRAKDHMVQDANGKQIPKGSFFISLHADDGRGVSSDSYPLVITDKRGRPCDMLAAESMRRGLSQHPIISEKLVVLNPELHGNGDPTIVQRLDMLVEAFKMNDTARMDEMINPDGVAMKELAEKIANGIIGVVNDPAIRVARGINDQPMAALQSPEQRTDAGDTTQPPNKTAQVTVLARNSEIALPPPIQRNGSGLTGLRRESGAIVQDNKGADTPQPKPTTAQANTLSLGSGSRA